MLLDRIVRQRGIARGAVAVLTVGLSALAVLAVETNTRTAEATAHVRTITAVSDQWDQLFLHIGIEHEALSDYLRADSAVGREPLSSALGSAIPSLRSLQASPDRGEAARARLIGGSYDAYTDSLRHVIAAGNARDPAAVQLYAEQASLSASTLRKQAVSSAAAKRRELSLYLNKVEERSDAFRDAAVALAAIDSVLLAFCVVVLLSYQRRTERQAKESAYRALHDGLTGIANRTLFVDRLTSALRLAERKDEQVGLLLLDLDRFKEINDTLGHHQGDTLLCEVADRLTRAIRESDTVARLGGDEFGILLHGVTSDTEVTEVARRVLSAMSAPVTLEGASADVGCSIGIAIYPEHGHDPTDLLKNADIAMYIAKRGHLGAVIYSAETNPYTSHDRVASA